MQKQGDGSHTTLGHVLDPSPASRHWMCQNSYTGFRNMTMTNAEPWSLLHLSLPALKQHWMKRKLFLPSWHVLPVHWGGQIHLNPSTRSWQVPPWPQGFGVQSSISAMQNKESLSSTTRLAMAITDKSDKWLLLLRFSLRNRRTTGLLFWISRLSLISAKASFKERSNVKRGFKALGEKFTLCSLFESGSPSKQHF